MSEYVNDIEYPPLDVSLMLRAHAELRCLSREVIPVLRQIETRAGLPDEQVGAAMAYLEVTWLEARRRAVETDGAHRELARIAPSMQCRDHDDDRLCGRACRYYDAVKALRDTVCRCVRPLLTACEQEPVPVPEASPGGV